jgi:HPt (histidine-containing phosphotransfer) domain-containing protein
VPASDGSGQASATDTALQRLAAVPGMDVARGVAACLGRRDRYVELFCRLLATQDGALVHLHDALAAGDRAAARFLAHSLKGAASALGANALAGQAAEMESMLCADAAAGAPEPALADRASAITRSVAALNAALDRQPA